MAQEDLRLLSAALALGRFTPSDLARVAKVKRNTVGSWLHRNQKYVQLDAELKAASGPGRPQKRFRLRDGAAVEMRRVLDGLYRAPPEHIEEGRSEVVRPHIFDRIELELANWRAAQRAGDADSMAENRVSARALIRIAWENLAAFHSAGGQVDHAHLKQLAELECESGLGALPEGDLLRPVASWLAQNVERMTARAVPVEFAGRVLRARAEARRVTDQIKVTAAALAAPVWSDEGLAANDVTEESLRLSAIVADIVPIEHRLSELSRAIDKTAMYGFCVDGQEAQAVVIGLATRPGADRSIAVRGWLASLHLTNDWLPELAPAVLRGLAEAPGIRLSALLDDLAQPLHETLADFRSRPAGRLRRQTLEFCERILQTPAAEQYRMHASNSSSLEQAVPGMVNRDSAQGNEASAREIATIFSYRPQFSDACSYVRA